MTTIKELTEKGLKCPNCKSKNIRSGYHDHQVMDSLICKDCGLRWREDCSPDNYSVERDIRIFNTPDRMIWVMHNTNEAILPIMNSKSADETDFDEFVNEGITNAKSLLAVHNARSIKRK